MNVGLEEEEEEEGGCTLELRDIDDTVELQECVEGHGEGGEAVGALPDLFKSGLSVPESTLERLVWVTGGEDELED